MRATRAIARTSCTRTASAPFAIESATVAAVPSKRWSAGTLSTALIVDLFDVPISTGRPSRFAAYSTAINLISAPMPLLGGWLVSQLTAAGYAIDLRLTFYAWTLFMFLAAAVATRLKEDGSTSVPALVFSYFPARMAGLLGINIAPMNAPFNKIGRAHV